MSGSQTTTGIPAIAAAVGYDTETFGPAINVGTTPNPTTSYPQFINGANVVPFDFFGNSWTNVGESNSNGSVTLNGTGETYGDGLATASVTPQGETLNGIAFGGGGYFQVTMAGNGPMSFWMNDAETMNGESNGSGTDGLAGGWMEADIAEFDSTGVYGFALHNWTSTADGGQGISTLNSGSPASPPGANYSVPNTYGMLWIPATATTQGYVKWYFNGQQVGNTITWNQYIPGQAAADNPYAVMDALHMVPILGAGSGSTVTFSDLEVWQASASNDIGTGVAALSTPTPTPSPTPTPTATPTPTPTVTPSANDAVVHAGSAAAITDSSGNAWTITSGGQVAINGAADTTTGNVTELAYVNGEVWQENTGGWWWGKTSPTAAWSPGAGTMTSPLPVTPTPTPTATPTPTPSPTASAIPTELTPTSGGTLTDAAGNRWTLTSAGAVDEDANAVPGGSGTAAIALDDNVLYGQDTTSKSWYTYSTTSQSWTSSAAPVLSSTVTIAANQTSTTVGGNAVSVNATSGNHMVFISGTGDTVSLSGGTDTVTDTGSSNTYVLPAAGKGYDTFTNNVLTSTDNLDLRTALAATNWNGSATTLSTYLTVTNSSHGAVLSIAPTSGGTATGIATIDGATGTTLSGLLAHALT
jgi:hypothetical protein